VRDLGLRINLDGYDLDALWTQEPLHDGLACRFEDRRNSERSSSMIAIRHLALVLVSVLGLGGGPGWLGVWLEADASGSPFVAEVRPDSPAEKAGLRVGDVLLAVDGVETDSISAVGRVIRTHEAGDELVFRVRRGTRVESIRVTLGTNPDDEAAAEPPASEPRGEGDRPGAPAGESGGAGQVGEAAYLGLDVIQREGGLFVEGTVPGGPAANAGVPSRGLLISIGGRRVSTMEQLDEAMASFRPGQAVSVRTLDGIETREFRVVLGSRYTVVDGEKPADPPAAAPTESKLPPPILGPALIVLGDPNDEVGRRQRLVLDDPAVRLAARRWGIRIEWADGVANEAWLESLGIGSLPVAVGIDGEDRRVATFLGYQPAERLAEQAKDVWRAMKEQYESTRDAPQDEGAGASDRDAVADTGDLVPAGPAVVAPAEVGADAEASEVDALRGEVESLRGEMQRLTEKLDAIQQMLERALRDRAAAPVKRGSGV
jgi:hypothetical protein